MTSNYKKPIFSVENTLYNKIPFQYNGTYVSFTDMKKMKREDKNGVQ